MDKPIIAAIFNPLYDETLLGKHVRGILMEFVKECTSENSHIRCFIKTFFYGSLLEIYIAINTFK